MLPRGLPQRRKNKNEGVDPRMNAIHGLSARIYGSGEDSVTAEDLEVFAKCFCDVGIPLFMANLDHPTAVDLFTLLSLSVRRCSDERLDDRSRLCYSKLRKAITGYIMEALKSDRVDDFARKATLVRLLSRTQTLCCYGDLLQDTTRQLVQQPSHNTAEAALELLSESSGLTSAIMDYMLSGGVVGCIDGDVTSARISGETHVVSGEFLSGGLLDAWVMCFLRLVASGECSSSKEIDVLRDFAKLIRSFLNPGFILITPSLGLFYLLVAHVVRAVAVLDGGTTYGIPADAPGVPLWGPNRIIVRSGSGGALDTELVEVALKLWHQLSSSDRSPGMAAAAVFPPYNHTATFDICVRLLDAVVAAARSPAAAARQQRRRAATVLLQRSACGRVAGPTLALALEALREIIGRSKAGLRLEDEERLQRLWAAYVRVLDAAMDAMAAEAPSGGSGGRAGASSTTAAMRSGGFRRLHFSGDWFAFQVPTIEDILPGGTGLPTRLGVEAAAVLSAGALPRMERLMRLRIKNAVSLRGLTTWTELLMFGPVSELAAFFVSAAKLLRASQQCIEQLDFAQKRAYIREFVEFPAAIGEAASNLQAVLFWQASNDLPSVLQKVFAAKAASRRDGIGATAGNGGEGEGAGVDASGGRGTGAVSSSSGQIAGVQQLAELTSFAFVTLLPALARALQYYESPAFGLYVKSYSNPCDMLNAMQGVLCGCAVLMAAAAPAAAPHSSGPRTAAAPDAVAASSAAPDAAGQWRALLLYDIDVIGLLGAAAKALSNPDGKVDQVRTGECVRAFIKALQAACSAVPDAVRAALRGQPLVQPCVGDAAAAASAVASAGGAGVTSGAGGNAAAGGSGTACRSYLTLSNLAKLLRPQGAFPNAEALEAVRSVLGHGAVSQPTGLEPMTAAILPPPDEVRRRMAPHCCANADCVNLEGPSEAALPRRRYGGSCGGGPWWYCSRECQVAHWRTGHSAECEEAGERTGARAAGAPSCGEGPAA